MAILTFPAIQNPSTVAWLPRANTQAQRSPMDKSTTTIELPGVMWVCAVSWDALIESESRKLEAFLARLRGQAGRFYYGPVHRATPLGVATGTPLVNGANQTGAVLNTDGWSNSITGILKAGDFIAFDTPTPAGWRELHQVVIDANSNGSGQSALTIEPPIRVSPADNATLIKASPTCVMKLRDDDQALARIIPPNFGTFALELEEAFA